MTEHSLVFASFFSFLSFILEILQKHFAVKHIAAIQQQQKNYNHKHFSQEEKSRAEAAVIVIINMFQVVRSSFLENMKFFLLCL